MNGTDIRAIAPGDDRTAISGIYEQSWKDAYRGIVPQTYLDAIPPGRWADKLDTPGWHTLVCLEDGRPVGTCSFCASRFPEFSGCGEIISIYFLPGYTGRGFGQQLLGAAVRELRALGFEEIFLWVLEENARARRFYEHFGFSPTEDFLDDSIGGKALREMRYVLNAQDAHRTINTTTD